MIISVVRNENADNDLDFQKTAQGSLSKILVIISYFTVIEKS